jgi:hypothetical protein
MRPTAVNFVAIEFYSSRQCYLAYAFGIDDLGVDDSKDISRHLTG